jgi:hypothetical protein
LAEKLVALAYKDESISSVPESVKKAPFSNMSPEDLQFQFSQSPKSSPPSSMRLVTCEDRIKSV